MHRQTDRSLREGSYKESPKPSRETRAINSRYPAGTIKDMV